VYHNRTHRARLNKKGENMEVLKVIGGIIAAIILVPLYIVLVCAVPGAAICLILWLVGII